MRTDAIKSGKSEFTWKPETEKKVDKIVREERRLEKRQRELVEKKRRIYRKDLESHK